MKKIAIVDDDKDSRESLAIQVEDAGYEPEIITGRFGNKKQELIDVIQKREVFGVISDHRLSPGHLANFYGSELLSSLYDLKIPSVLITQFLDEESDTTIRRYRDKLPAVIGRGDQNPKLLRELLEFSQRELSVGKDVTRMPHRALIRIDDYHQDGLIEGIVTNWSSELVVKFEATQIPENVRVQMNDSGVNRLMAFVNTGALDQSKIFITNIHLAPKFKDIDELS